MSNFPGASREEVPDCELRRAVAAPAQGLPPDANTEQKRKTKRKAIEHEKPTEYEPRYPFKPRIGLGPGHLVSSPSAIRRTWGWEDDDEGNMMNQTGGWMGGWAGGGMWVWTVVGILVIVLLVVVISRLINRFVQCETKMDRFKLHLAKIMCVEQEMQGS